jgi:RHS repeat-associated protein
VGKDVFAFSLHYFKGDYQASNLASLPQGIQNAIYQQHLQTSAWGTTHSLYNGNIAMMNTAIHVGAGVTNLPAMPATPTSPASPARAIPKLSATPLQQRMVYAYDQLNRIKTAQAAQVGIVGSTSTTPYAESYTYDGNGNIQTLKRNNATVEIDDLVYHYIAGTNKLEKVTDNPLNESKVNDDIDNQAANNYVYDAIGNLIADKSEGIDNIAWTVYGKVAQMHRIDPTTKNDITVVYDYDAMGNRIRKATTIKEALAHPTYAPNAFGSRKTTYYVRDAQGNVLSVYDQKDYVSINAAGVATVITNVMPRPTTPATPNPEPLPVFPLALTEQIIYGSARIGAYKPQRNQKLLATDPNRGKIIPILAGQLTLGYKSYELSNHLGNVLTTITDNKIIIQSGGEVTVSAVVLTTQDYYPFGMAMTERGYQNVDRNEQRYGFNGMEIDEDFGEGSYTTLYRMLDVRIGRWLSTDPKADKYPNTTPYNVNFNNPVFLLDAKGDEPVTAAVYVGLFIQGMVFELIAQGLPNIIEATFLNPKFDMDSKDGKLAGRTDDGYVGLGGAMSQAFANMDWADVFIAGGANMATMGGASLARFGNLSNKMVNLLKNPKVSSTIITGITEALKTCFDIKGLDLTQLNFSEIMEGNFSSLTEIGSFEGIGGDKKLVDVVFDAIGGSIATGINFRGDFEKYTDERLKELTELPEGLNARTKLGKYYKQAANKLENVDAFIGSGVGAVSDIFKALFKQVFEMNISTKKEDKK